MVQILNFGYITLVGREIRISDAHIHSSFRQPGSLINIRIQLHPLMDCENALLLASILVFLVYEKVLFSLLPFQLKQYAHM